MVPLCLPPLLLVLLFLLYYTVQIDCDSTYYYHRLKALSKEISELNEELGQERVAARHLAKENVALQNQVASLECEYY